MNKLYTKKTFLALVVGAIIIVATLTACAPASLPAEPASPGVEAPGEVQRITPEESMAAFDNGEAVFLDVRSASSYAASHIPDALSIPLAELEARIDEIDPNQWVITYCT